MLGTCDVFHLSPDHEVFDEFDYGDLKKIDEGGEGVIYYWERENKMIKVFPSGDKQKEKISLLEFLIFYHRVDLLNDLEKVATIPQLIVGEVGIGCYLSMGKVDDYGHNEDTYFPDMHYNKNTIGYTMENLQGWWELSQITDPDFRKENGIGFKDIALIFLEIHRAVKMIHAKGFIIGDFNLRNILVKPKENWKDSGFAEIRIIDTDSWGINRPDLDLVFEPSALDDEIVYPARRKNREKGEPLVPFSQKEDWWSFAYLFSRCLLGFDPFATGTTVNDLGRSERSADGITVWLGNVRATRTEAIAAVRIGFKMKLMLRRWLRCQSEGEFPGEVMLEFYGGITRCKNNDCLMQFHKSTCFCPNCGTII